MRKSSWTPSIVPSDDQNVYLVVDDFGQFGRVWREADIEKTDLETVIDDLLHGQTTRSAFLASTPQRAGRGMSPATLPKSCAGAVICRCATSPPALWIS
jgi:hypothetical protein